MDLMYTFWRRLQEDKARKKKEETKRMREEFRAKQDEDDDFLSFLRGGDEVR